MKTTIEIARSMPFWDDPKFWERLLWQQKSHYERAKNIAHLYLSGDELDEYRRWEFGNRREHYIKWRHMNAFVDSHPNSSPSAIMADNLSATRYLPI